MPRIACYADFTTKPEFTEQMVELFKTVIPATHKEPGVEQYIVTRSLTDPNHWKIFELYASQEGHDGHMNGEYLKIKAFVEKHSPLAGPPSLVQHELLVDV